MATWFAEKKNCQFLKKLEEDCRLQLTPVSCYVLRSFLQPRKKTPNQTVPLAVDQTMVCSFPALRCFWASFILLQPVKREEHNTDFRTVKGFVQSPPCSSTVGWDAVWISCCWGWRFPLCLLRRAAHLPVALHSFMCDRALGCCTSSCF